MKFFVLFFALLQLANASLLSQNVAASPELASGEGGSGGSGEVIDETDESGAISAGAIAAIVVASLLALGAVVAGALLYFFRPPASKGVNPASLSGTAARFGKPVPCLVISAESLA